MADVPNEIPHHANPPAEATSHAPPSPPEPPAADQPPQPASKGRKWIGLGVVLAAVAASALLGYPRVMRALHTVSTDDAYVNGHVTFVAPRIAESVVEVRFDNNDPVKKGDLLVRLDEAMSKIRVDQARTALALAKTNLSTQLASAKAIVASAKANRYKLASAITDINNQVASLRAAIADQRQREAAEQLAKLETERYTRLAKNNSVTQEQADMRASDYTQARQATLSAQEQVRKLRVGLEVPENPPEGKPLDDLPSDLDQRHSAVLSALGDFAFDLARLGLPLPGFYQTPDDFTAQIRNEAPNGDLDTLVEQTVAKSPGVQTAQEQILQSEHDLAMAELNLSYCRIYADIDGFLSNRNVNPGDRLAQGQRLMAIRSLDEIWIDCNFKETQLEPIRIGHPVDLHVDTYPGKVFPARVTGFNPGTGSSLALLPPQNATGNFVKIVQRLPVRVELTGPNPRDTPLFIGLSCTPYIRIADPPAGPDAGQRLRGNSPEIGPKAAPRTAPNRHALWHGQPTP